MDVRNIIRKHILLLSLLIVGCATNHETDKQGVMKNEADRFPPLDEVPITGDHSITANLHGRVLEKSSGEPIDYAQVFILHSTPFFYDIEAQGVSDASGVFSFDASIGGYSYATRSQIESGKYFIGVGQFYYGVRKSGFSDVIGFWEPLIWIPGACTEDGIRIRLPDINLISEDK